MYFFKKKCREFFEKTLFLQNRKKIANLQYKMLKFPSNVFIRRNCEIIEKFENFQTREKM